MGFVRKVTGVQGQIDATNRAADMEAQNLQQQAQANANALNQSAQATAQNQQMLAARAVAEDAARTQASQALETVDVATQDTPTDSTIGMARKRRAQFGKNYSSGVNI